MVPFLYDGFKTRRRKIIICILKIKLNVQPAPVSGKNDFETTFETKKTSEIYKKEKEETNSSGRLLANLPSKLGTKTISEAVADPPLDLSTVKVPPLDTKRWKNNLYCM